MKRLIFSNWWRRTSLFLTGTALALTALGISVTPALTTPPREQIATRITELQASQQRWIQIDLTKQRLIAWDGGRPVYALIISTGKRSTPTRPGIFTIQSKRRTDRMRGVGYDVPRVPYVMYYHRGFAIHGTNWHRRFGTPVSHGCINVAVNHAQWLFNWTSVGTPVVIHQ